MTQDLTEADAWHVYFAWCRWWRAKTIGERTAAAEDDRRLVIQAVLLWTEELAPVLRDVRCPACRAWLPNAMGQVHAQTCDAVPAVRRWRLAANEAWVLTTALPEAERAAAPPTFERARGHLDPGHVEPATLALGRSGTLRHRVGALLETLLEHPAATPALGGDDSGAWLRSGCHGPTYELNLSALIGLVDARTYLDDARALRCAWCAATVPALLAHYVECPRHPLAAEAAVLEDWCEGRRGRARHPVVATLRALHERRTALRHLLAACDAFEDAFGSDGEHGSVREGDEQVLDLARQAGEALAATPLPPPTGAAGSDLAQTEADAGDLHAQLGRLVAACRAFTTGFGDDVRRASWPPVDLEEAWTTARREARAHLAYPADWNREPPEDLPRTFVLRTAAGHALWRTGEPLLEGAALHDALLRLDSGRGPRR